MRITIIGAYGQLGQDLMVSLIKNGHKLTGLSHQQISIENVDSVTYALDKSSPEVVINVAAYNKVDQAEKEPEIAFAINALGPRLLAQYCHQHNLCLLHVSTDYVFGLDGFRNKAYNEIDMPAPVNVYGQSKLAGEYFVRSICSKHYVVRTCGLYGSKSRNGNFVETILRIGGECGELSLINDQYCAPTSTYDLSVAISKLIMTDQFGLYHATSGGQTTWYGFAMAIFELTGVNMLVKPITTEQYGAIADRPRFSVLDCSKLENTTGYLLPMWKQALSIYLE